MRPPDSIKRNKCPRRHQRAIRLAPAHQHFGATQLAGADIDDGLIVGNEFAGIERVLDLGQRVAWRAARHQRTNTREGSHDDAGAEYSKPLEVSPLGGDAGARRQNFYGEAEFFRPGIGAKIRTGLPEGPLAGFTNNRALPGHDARIGAEWAALRGHLRKEQCRRHQCGHAVGTRPDLAAQPHHAFAVRHRDNVKRIARGILQRLR